MRAGFTLAIVIAVLSNVVAIAIAQSSTDAGAFEAASVKPHKSDEQGSIRLTPGGQLTITAMPLREIIRFAYVQQYQLAGEPKWVDSERFDIVAKIERQISPQRVRLMLRALLADRFKLAV